MSHSRFAIFSDAGLADVMQWYQNTFGGNPERFKREFPVIEFWRFFIDGCLQKKENWQGFEERKPNYLKGMFNASVLMFDLWENLTINFILDFHRLAMQDVENTNYKKPEIDNIGIRKDPNNSMVFGVCSKEEDPVAYNATTDGMAEFLTRNLSKNSMQTITVDLDSVSTRCRYDISWKLLDELKNRVKKNDSLEKQYDDIFSVLLKYSSEPLKKRIEKEGYHYLNKHCEFLKEIIDTDGTAKAIAECVIKKMSMKDKNFNFYIRSKQKVAVYETLVMTMNQYISEYEVSINSVKPLDKLKAIIRFVQRCEQLHPFLDGNGRTFCMLLLNHLLLKNGFPMVIMDDSNRFDLYSENELLKEVFDGMNNLRKLVETKKINDVDTLDVLKEMDPTSPQFGYFDDLILLWTEWINQPDYHV